MLENLFKRGKSNSEFDFSTDTNQLRSIAGSTSAQLAAELLCAPGALGALSRNEAHMVVQYMRPKFYSAGIRVMKEGDDDNTHFMFLILEGEVTIESYVVSRNTPVTLTVLGPGELIGEMGLLDGEARSANCTVTADVRCAILTRQALEDLMHNEPVIAGKLMTSIALRLARRLRETSDKLKRCTQLVQTMQHEIEALLPTPELMHHSKLPQTATNSIV